MKISRISIVLIYHLFVGLVSHAYGSELEPLLQTSPNIDATEYILILNNNLLHSIDYLEGIFSDLDTPTTKHGENKLKINIRKAHLHYLKAYAYLFHNSDFSYLKKNSLAISEINTAIMMIEKIMLQTPKYSDIYRLHAVSAWLYGKVGVAGLKKMIQYNSRALKSANTAVSLNENNIMAKVVLNNFHALAPRWMGANTSEGVAIISVDIPANISDSIMGNIPKAQMFEFYFSRYYIYNTLRNKPKRKESIAMIKSLYKNSWRISQIKGQK